MTDQFTTPIPRDRYGRPMVLMPDSDKRMAYRRTTTFVGVLEDTYNLMQWKQRQTALGLAARDDLMLGVKAAKADDKKTLNGLCEQAVEAAQSGAKATIGTALHSFTEQLDMGTLDRVPHPYDKDIAAYEQATEQMDMIAIEQFRVFDSWQVAGTADRIARYKGACYIADVKTGDIEWGALKISMQLAMYARSTAYVNDSRVDDAQPISVTKGIVIHLPAGTGTCTLHWVNLEKGWLACQTAYRVWEARGWKRELMHPLTEPSNPVTLSGDKWVMAAEAATTVEELRAVWASAKEAGKLDKALADTILMLRDKLTGG